MFQEPICDSQVLTRTDLQHVLLPFNTRTPATTIDGTKRSTAAAERIVSIDINFLIYSINTIWLGPDIRTLYEGARNAM
jgi:hypothetical protein